MTKKISFDPAEFPTLSTYPLDWIAKAVQSLIKNQNLTKHQALVNLEQDLSEVEQ